MIQQSAGAGLIRFVSVAIRLLATASVGSPSLGHAADAARIREIAAELNIPRRAWTICTVNEVGRAVEAEPSADAPVMADRALAACADEEQALRAKAVDLLGAEAAERLMTRLVAEAHEALIGSVRSLEAAKAGGDRLDPSWPRVLGPAH